MTFKRPNFVVIVADDLGFTDLGAFGGEIETPHLDELARNGVRFTDFHTASACSPTRSMLFSGTDNHIAGLGQMAEFARNHANTFGGKPGYEGYLNFRVAALPEILQDAGYYTFQSGKWHLGLTLEYWPSKRGFEKSFTLLPGAGNHYKYFPVDSEGKSVAFMQPLFQENDKEFNPFDLPENYYSTEYFTTKFLEYLESDARDGRPFFGALTYTAPHWPFQAPRDLINKYKGLYNNGPLKLRKERLERALQLGIIPDGVEPHVVVTQRDKSWEDLSDEERATEARIMEIYAAMVEYMDSQIGRLVQSLKKQNELENTFLLFMSDNGAEGMLMEAMPLRNQNFQQNLKDLYDNSFANIGNGNSFVWYSDQWAQAATAPYYMYKMWATEGGIRCPLIVHYPDLTNGFANKISNAFTTVMDILPTILDIAGVNHPGKQFRGREVVSIKGKSWKSVIAGAAQEVHNDDTVTGWELFAQKAIRKGYWKAIYIPKPLGPEKWQLFDLKNDPGETIDLADQNDTKLGELLDHWIEYVAETGLVECTEVFYNDTEYDPKVID